MPLSVITSTADDLENEELRKMFINASPIQEILEQANRRKLDKKKCPKCHSYNPEQTKFFSNFLKNAVLMDGSKNMKRNWRHLRNPETFFFR